ncbi:MAG: hypothetical protein RugAbin2_00158 [Rugosibacter sp.]|jgi:hypothetical protein|nr:hypothetical protein [Rugosibacter sp.]
MKHGRDEMKHGGLMALRLMAFLLIAGCLLSGCAGLALTAVGVGGGAATAHQMGGLAYRTFTEPLPRVRGAVLAAFRRMDIKPKTTEKIELGERILARVGDRDIEVELESLTPKTTRMRVAARRDGGLFMDSATAVEIITQTEKAFGLN